MATFTANPGDTFDRWVVLGDAPRIESGGSTFRAYYCRCVCGVEKALMAQLLRDRKSRSCGCNGRVVPEIGAKFGHLAVVDRYYNDTAKTWHLVAKCWCGTEVDRSFVAFIKAKQPLRSCGCKGRIFTNEKASCRVCFRVFPLNEFEVRTERTRGVHEKCRDCLRASRLLRNFNVSLEAVKALLEYQDGSCALCLEPEIALRNGRLKNLAVDHDHSCCPEKGKSCGKCIRGLLCQQCNTGLGMFESKPATKKLFVNYLDPKRIAEVHRVLEEAL